MRCLFRCSAPAPPVPSAGSAWRWAPRQLWLAYGNFRVRVLIEINKKVGFRLLTKLGTRGSIDLVKGIPLVGGGVGAGVNVVAINRIAKYSKAIFVPLGAASE